MKQLLLFLICNLAFLLTVQGNSAEIPPAVMFKQLSTTEGLSNNSVRSIYRDNRGFLWVGTESGLNKYDGYSFQQYYQNNSDLPDDAISEIFEGPDDNVWIRTSSGYSIYNYKTGKFDNDYNPRMSFGPTTIPNFTYEAWTTAPSKPIHWQLKRFQTSI